jgi:hypothetical protein
MSEKNKEGGDRQGGGMGLTQAEKVVVEFPNVRLERRQREFYDAVLRFKAALAEDKSVPLTTRQALVAELGMFDNWPAKSDTFAPGSTLGRELARRIMLLDYRLSVLGPMADWLDDSLRHAVRQYAEAANLLLDAAARRGPDGEWVDRPRRTEIEALVVALTRKARPEGSDGPGRG